MQQLSSGYYFLFALALYAWSYSAAASETLQPDAAVDAAAMRHLDAYEAVMRRLQGEPVTVGASLSLCRELTPGANLTIEAAKAWYFSVGDCQTEYEPDIEALVTSAALGAKNISLDDADAWQALRQDLARLRYSVAEGDIAPLRKLEIQHLAWEFLAGIRLYRTGEIGQLTPLLAEVQALLSAALLTHHDLQGLTGSLTAVATDAAAAGISSSILSRIIEPDDNIVEVTSHTNMHLGLTRGRWSARVFLAASNAEDRNRLRAMLCRAGVELLGLVWSDNCPDKGPAVKSAAHLVNLHYEISKLDAALVLYFNALMEDWTIVATPVIASWREYTINGSLDANMDFPEVQKHFSFAAAEYRRQFDDTTDALPRYKWIGEASPVVFGALDVHPTAFDPVTFMTTQRARCLQCHGHHIRAFSGLPSSAPSIVTSAFFYPGNSPHILGNVGYFEKELATWLKPAEEETRGVRQ